MGKNNENSDLVCEKFHAQIRLVNCIGFLWIQHVCHFISRDMGYYEFYFQGYEILCSIILFSFRDICDIAGRYIDKFFMRRSLMISLVT